MAAVRTHGVPGAGAARVAAVVSRHERALLRVARQASLCDDDALDAYQRALEIFIRRVDTVDPATELAWLRVVVRHEAMAIRRARSESVAGDDLDVDGFVPGGGRSVEEVIASGERVRRSAEALRALKPDEAKALMMKAHGLSYAEIGERCGWSYTKVNRAITEGRRRFIAAYEGIESGEECERFAPILEALAAGTATSKQVLSIRPHLRHCTACRATVRELHLSRLRRASLLWPLFAFAEPLGRLPAPPEPLDRLSPPSVEERLQELAVDAPAVSGPTDAALPMPQVTDGGLQIPLELPPLPEPADHVGRLDALRHDITAFFHRAQASDVATGVHMATASGGGRIATIAAVLGLCLSSAGVGTVCVVNLLRDYPRAAEYPKPTLKPPKRGVANSQTKSPVAETQSEQLTRLKSSPAQTHASRGTLRNELQPRQPQQARSQTQQAAEREFGFEEAATASHGGDPPQVAIATTAHQRSPTRPAGASEPDQPNPAEAEFHVAEQEFSP